MVSAKGAERGRGARFAEFARNDGVGWGYDLRFG